MSRINSYHPRQQTSPAKSRTDSQPHNLRQVYISPHRNSKQPEASNEHVLRNTDTLPPRATHFKRDSRHRSRSRLNDTRLYSEEKTSGRGRDLEQRVRGLEDRLSNEVREKEKLQELNKANLAKLKKVMDEVSKATM